MSIVTLPTAARDAGADHRARAATLLEALPYLRTFAGTTMVVCLAGAALASRDALTLIARDVALLRFVGIVPVVTHAGGEDVARFLRRFDLEAAPSDDPEVAELTKMVLLGKVNGEIVTALRVAGQPACGISGDDGGLLAAGAGGGPGSIRVDVVRRLCDRYIAVIAAAASSWHGAPVTFAGAGFGERLAVALEARKLLYLDDIDATDLSARLGLRGRRRAAVGEIEFAPEPLDSCRRAVQAGVGAAHVLDARQPHSLLLELFTDRGAGFMVTNPTPEHEDAACA
jgi:acetylglutamate kinase